MLPDRLKCPSLQEYFIPRERYAEFVERAKPIVLTSLNAETCLTLLNVTIRFVHQDTHTALPYARHASGVFAFVFYYRLRRTAEADEVLRKHHAALVAASLKSGGTFYLPYRHHYSDADLAAAYPDLPSFCKAKMEHDPAGLFGNLWSDRYLSNVLPIPMERPNSPMTLADPGRGGSSSCEDGDALPSEREFLEPFDDAVSVTSAGKMSLSSSKHHQHTNLPSLLGPLQSRRTGSFRALLRDPALRAAFYDGFLVDVFNLMPARQVQRMLSAAAWDARLKDDAAIYDALRAALDAAGKDSPLAQVSSLWSGIWQVNAQKREITRETVSVLARLRRVGSVHSLVSIGDHGKLVTPLRQALGMRGPVWIVHDTDAGSDDTGAVLERGAMNRADLGTFLRINYASVGRHALAGIPNDAADLVTMNQGLHHLIPSQLPGFLAEVARVLRPGGVFIIREHALDAPDARLLPMLDCAHMIFNAITGVPALDEAQVRYLIAPRYNLNHTLRFAGAAQLPAAAGLAHHRGGHVRPRRCACVRDAATRPYHRRHDELHQTARARPVGAHCSSSGGSAAAPAAAGAALRRGGGGADGLEPAARHRYG
jgi:SAM-dependent methyltransferase